MEIKINKEIRDYEEQMIFGLSLRQIAYAAAAMILSVVTYLLLDGILGREVTSWICMAVSAVPLIMGFFRYDGMKGGRFLLCLLRNIIYENRVITYSDRSVFTAVMDTQSERS